MGRPTLVVVSGPAGSGKTTLAHLLAAEIGCPAICRDEIKEGMVHAEPGFVPAPSDPLTMRTLEVFFAVLDRLLRAEVTVVAEAAFQDKVWRPRLEPFRDLAELRILTCTVDDEVARRRTRQRMTGVVTRAAHADSAHLEDPANRAPFVYPALDVPTLSVDTSGSYSPGLAEMTAFVDRR